MKDFVLNAKWVNTIRDGYNKQWNYDYKEYIFNDQYTAGYSIIIPQKAYGIKAMEQSNGRGIKEEYNKVYFENGDIVTKIFDVDAIPDPKDLIIEDLSEKIEILKAQNQSLHLRLSQIFGILMEDKKNEIFLQ